MLKDRRIGQFHVDKDAIDSSPEGMRAMLRDVIVMQAFERPAHPHQVAYIGMHPAFRWLAQTESPPLYTAEIKEDKCPHTGKINDRTVTWREQGPFADEIVMFKLRREIALEALFLAQHLRDATFTASLNDIKLSAELHGRCSRFIDALSNT